MVYGLLTCPHNNAPAQRKKTKNLVAKSLFIEVALVKPGKGAVMRKYVGTFRVLKYVEMFRVRKYVGMFRVLK